MDGIAKSTATVQTTTIAMKRPTNYLELSLQELKKDYWRRPSLPTSHLITECHRLRKVPLKDLTVGNLRIMIGQEIGLDYLNAAGPDRTRKGSDGRG